MCVCCLGENQFGSPPDKLIKKILEKMLKIFMIKSKIYPLNRFISHVKMIARSYSDLYSDQIETSFVAVSYCFVNKTGY